MEQTGYHLVLEPDPARGNVALVPDLPGRYSHGETAVNSTENAPGPDEFFAEGEPLDWEGEGWS